MDQIEPGSAAVYTKPCFIENQILKIFKEYDVNGDAEIDWEEFRFFAMAALSD